MQGCLPEPKVRSHVIEAAVESCTPPSRAFAGALAEWERAVARVTWAARHGDAGSDCAAYVARAQNLYTPFTDSPSDRIEPAAVWPPTDTTSFLSLMELGPVPPEYRRLLR